MRKPLGVQPRRSVFNTKKNIPHQRDALTGLRGASGNDVGMSSGCVGHVKYLFQNHVGGHEASASTRGAIPSVRIRGFSRRRPVFDNGFQGITPFLTHLYLAFRHWLSAFPQNHRLHVGTSRLRIRDLTVDRGEMSTEIRNLRKQPRSSLPARQQTR
jgi:hypothetical protein